MSTLRVAAIALITSAVAAGSCGKKKKELSPAEINAMADSIVQMKMEQLRREAKEDLDRRLPIEIKPKIDSILRIDYGTPAAPRLQDIGMEADTILPLSNSTTTPDE